MENNDPIKIPPKLKKTKNVTKDELLQLDKEELVDRIIQLEAHNAQLKNIISKNISETDETGNKNKKQYDFSKCHHRRILLKFLYFGWDYHGLAVQEDTTQTIEHHLFKALVKTCLIQSREKSQYHRCGRTDKGVSAFGQVISITVRSKHPSDIQNLAESLSTEIEYCKLLNRVLPKDIRAVTWMPIPDHCESYSARFDCKKRKYKYYFPKSSLNIFAMRDACSRLIGSHDFRHLCKMDVGNGVTQFRREILTADIVAVNEGGEPTSMYVLILEGNAFLWHQIRCIMGVLLLIGEGKEEPRVINDLLDVETNERKPQYNMAIDVPLNLFECTYDLEKASNWVYTDELKSVIEILQKMWALQNVKATMIKDCIENLENIHYSINKNKSVTEMENCESNVVGIDSIMVYSDGLTQGVKPRKYVPLLKREVCSSLEERIEHYMKKRKCDDNIGT
ncbi:tRNA pseudouridine(38/39) synthase [Pieris brassicae]|uniref:Pseudouridine synthase I TruA alpha/beta domain-containing protein n=1 Tax=Pieris brassicae TaxID=7116 RepID=A0A9P0TNA8_PIEBR|nr:tRNA pseudouridine(38/39) synthase [Pieris brassicae]CAH4032358.1 unnamed protein product [Pieris brassicae]